MIFEGALSVKAAIQGKNRKVNKVFIAKEKKDRDTSFILRLCQSENIPVVRMPKDKINEMTTGKTHGGVIAEVENRNYQHEDSIDINNAFIVAIEGVEDPFNLGYMLRTLYSAGCTCVLVNDRDWAHVESVIAKASAGAFEFINIVKCQQMSKTIEKLKSNGVICYAAYRNDAIEYGDADYTKPCLIAVGGEMRGLSRDVLSMMDQHIYIPYANDFRNALNASSATAVLAYEVLRQRKGNK